MTAAPDLTPLVLVYAGGSVFGRLLADDLLAATTARLLLVGPNGGPEREAARDLDPSGERVTAAQAPLDDEAALRALLAGVSAAVLCVRGFRGLPLTLLDACSPRAWPTSTSPIAAAICIASWPAAPPSTRPA